jgi:hypothetical protein
MTKEFVPYELAVKLEQLGFDEPCFAWYVSESYGLEYGKVVKSDLIKDGIVAPTFSQAFRWFREKGYLIDVTSLNSDEYEFYIKWSFAYSILSDIYKTYEEAELACLDKLIEIVRRNKEEQ